MTHEVQLIVGREPAVDVFLAAWPGARTVDLAGGWRAIPVDDALHEAIAAAHPGAKRPEELDVSPLGLEAALAEATRGGGGLAYVETSYWGGSGGQSAMAYVDGHVAHHPARAKGAGGPINAALRAIGVKRTADDDEFDTIGLGARRTMSDYEPEGPVRLRAAAPATDTGGYLPVWLILLVIAAAITAGVVVATMR